LPARRHLCGAHYLMKVLKGLVVVPLKLLSQSHQRDSR
jgi:hypothetical protein